MTESIVIAAVPPILAFLLAKLSEFGAQQRVSRAYKQAQEELAFWKSFVEVETLVSSDGEMVSIKAAARVDLEAIRSRISEVNHGRLPAIPASLVRQVLLLYPPGQPRTWIARIVFYLLAVYGFLLTLGSLTSSILWNWPLLPVTSGIIIMVFVLAGWTRTIARNMDRPQV